MMTTTRAAYYGILQTYVKYLRHLTETECKRLRIKGISCSVKWQVSPRGDGSGLLYYPDGLNRWTNADIEVFE